MAHVVLIASYAPSLPRFRGPLIRALVAAGHRVTAMAPEPSAPEGFDALGATYESCALERTGTRPDRDIRAMLKLARQLRRLRPDVVLGYTMKPVSFGTLAARLARVPRRYALVTGLGYLFIRDGSRKQRWVRRLALPVVRAGLSSSTAVFVQNPDDLADLIREGVLSEGHPTQRFWGSGIDLESYPTQPLPKGPTTFLLVARLLRDKGVREFVEAARSVHATHPDARFVLVGPTDTNPAGIPESEVQAWSREGVVEVAGETSDVRPFLRDCTVYVLPSYREGTPRSVLEAMATGRAIITTDAPGCRETVVHDQTGLLVPVRDAQGLASAMRRYLDEPGLIERHGTASLQRAKDLFDVQKVNAAMLEAMGL